MRGMPVSTLYPWMGIAIKRVSTAMIVPDLSKLIRMPNRRSGVGPLAVIHWDRERLYFFIGSIREPLTDTSTGTIELTPQSKPIAAFAEHLSQSNRKINQVLVLLSRPELDLSTLTLPKGDEKETSAMVASEIEQQYADAHEPPSVDFAVSSPNQETDANSEVNNVLVFSAQPKYLQSLEQQATASGLKLVGVGARHLGPLSLIKRHPVLKDGFTIAIQFYPGETEISMCHDAMPILLRSIRNSTDDSERVAEQVAIEVERCLTLLPHTIVTLPIQLALFGDNQFASSVTSALRSHEQLTVSIVVPSEGWNVSSQVPPTASTATLPIDGAFASNLGAAWDYFHKCLPVNLLRPKRPPKPVNPWVRRSVLGGLIAAAAAVAAYVLLSDISELRTEVAQRETEFANTSKVTAKYQQKADKVQAVEEWLSNQTDWLAELNEVSKRLPEGQNATVRRLTANLSGSGAAIDLSVQVNQQEYISVLEDRLKSAKYSVLSRQISQSPETSDYPWHFETRITFAANAPIDKRFAPPVSSPSDITIAPKPDSGKQLDPQARPSK
jgi:hypothetical protein